MSDVPPLVPGRVVPITTYHAVASSGDVVGRYEVVPVCTGQWSVYDDILGCKLVGGLTRSGAIARARKEAWRAIEAADADAARPRKESDA